MTGKGNKSGKAVKVEIAAGKAAPRVRKGSKKAPTVQADSNGEEAEEEEEAEQADEEDAHKPEKPSGTGSKRKASARGQACNTAVKGSHAAGKAVKKVKEN